MLVGRAEHHEIGALGCRTELYTPDHREDQLLPIVLAARAAVDAVKKEGAAMSLRSLRGSMVIRASNENKTAGIELAVGRGAIDETKGTRNSRQFTYVMDLPEDGIS